MIEVTPRLVFLLAFLTAVTFYVWRDKKLERHSILFIRRTKKGIRTIDRIAKRLPRFWKYYGWAGVATGLVSVVAAAVMIAYTFFNMFQTQSAESGPSLILPGLVSDTTLNPGVTFVPVEYWVISIIVLMTVHEMSHGIVARSENIEIKSVGWAIVGILPLGAFVEPEGEKMLPDDGEEEEESKATWNVGDWKSRLKVLCAGSFANYITALLFFLLATGMTAALTQPSLIYNAQEGYPAYESGMDNGTLVAVNGEKVDSMEEVRSITSEIQVNETVEIWSSEGNFSFQATSKDDHEGGYIGILMGQTSVAKDSISEYSMGIQWFLSLLITVSFLNFLVGLFNMVPIKPLDGGLVVETLTSEFLGEDKIAGVNKFSLVVWAFLLAAIVMGIVTTFIL